MSEEDDLSAWGDALNEQAAAKENADENKPDAIEEEDPWGDALNEQAEATQDELSQETFDAIKAERGE